MNTMKIYMRKAVNIKNSTRVLDSWQTHGVQMAEVSELKSIPDSAVDK